MDRFLSSWSFRIGLGVLVVMCIYVPWQWAYDPSAVDLTRPALQFAALAALVTLSYLVERSLQKGE